VHLVDEEVDHGPVVAQEALPVLPDDTWESLEARVHEVEHRVLPSAVRALLEGRVSVDGRVVRIRGEDQT
jgi:phosphoribosylglycinamide formyltransferase-1